MAAAVLATACSKPPPAAAPPAPAEVAALTVSAREVPVTFEFVGQTESSQQVEIRARIDGFLEKRVYTEGSAVKAGQVMFLIDRKPFDANLAAANAELAQQQARLTTARANLTRVKPLVADHALSARDLDDATGQEQAAAAAVEAAKAKVTDAKLNAGYATITSPVSGLSSFAKVQEGAYVNASNSLLTYVAKLDPMRVNFSLSENEVLRVRAETAKGQLKGSDRAHYTVTLRMADGSIYPFPGRITFADAAFSQDTGTFLLRAELPNPKGDLHPGQFVRVSVYGFTRPNSIVLPQRAVQQGPRGYFVWLVDKDNKAAQREVEAGEWLGDNWLVGSGLKDGDRVVVDGVMRLAPGVPVKATAAPAVVIPTAAEMQASAAGAAGGTGAHVAAPAGGLGRVLFAKGSAVLDTRAKATLEQLAATMKASPSLHVTVSGYVDSDGSHAANTTLAKNRAVAVRDALAAAGVQADRIALRPPADIVGGADHDQARRVDIAEAAAR
ncbi:efflux RND transporter periplasmic adaptor subunit [Piscinibacter gummiphilus]|nr:efflux RND transporter periplasmic adaptor subunit [Piscinibacter gummiphilus]